MTALLALLSAAFIGGADFIGGATSRTTNGLKVAAFAAVVGLPLALVVSLAYGAERLNRSDVGWSVVAGVVVSFGIVCFYTAMGRGLISVVAPVAAVTGAIVPVAYALARGERPGTLALVGLGTALVAIAVVSLAPSEQHSGAAEIDALVIGLALASGLLFGLFYISFSRVSEDAGLWPVTISRAVGALVLVAVALIAVRNPLEGSRRLLRPTLAIAVLEVAAGVPLLLALQRGPVSIASVVASLYPVMTVLLAGVVLRERLSSLQYAGVACALASVVLVSSG